MSAAFGRGLSWTAAVALLVAAERLTVDSSALVRMFTVIGALFVGMKAVVIVEWKAQTSRALAWRRYAAFALAWPGMRPGDFARPRDSVRPLSAWPGWRAVALGSVLVAAARYTWPRSPELAFALALPGFSLILHFGLFRLVAVFWRGHGYDVAPPFDAPLLSTSLGEFWSRRWNRAFSEMTALAVYRPVARRFGTAAALAAAFVLSGVLHELAISVPARGGFGGPMAYFLLHGGLVGVERSLQARGRFPWTSGWGRLWTVLWLVLPLPILFHRPFLETVVRPLLD